MMSLLEKKIFVVDDDELLAKAYSRQLHNLGFEDVSTLFNGTDCINALFEKPFLVFLDYQMDDVNGYDVLRKIKRFDPNIYVVIMSSQKDVGNAVKMLKHGAFDYIVKGSDDLQRVESALQRIELVEEHLLTPKVSIISRIINLF